MSLILPLARQFLNVMSSQKIRFFEESLKDPQKAQAYLLNKWKADKTHLEKVVGHEYTSGSSGAKKKITYTKSLKNSFSDMFQIWACDILNNAPIKLDSGVVYMSLSPRINDHGGLDNDTEYVSPLMRPLLKKFLAVDPAMQRVTSGEEFYHQVAKQLLARRDLEIISIWSPTYFLNLLDYIETHKKELGFSGSFNDHWPHLQMISAWSSGESQSSAEELKKIFPEVWFQGKGLMATEGPMTIPWIKSQGMLPLLNHTYFEFMNQSHDRLLLHQLKEGEEYEILPRFPNMETRYEIGDKVVCTGHYQKTPMLEFLGRKGDSSDMVGEKLSGNILRELFTHDFLDFVIIANKDDKNFHYTIIAESQNSNSKLDAVAIENKLQSIHHYKLARDLNQLRPSRLLYVNGLKKEIKNIQLNLGIREGDQKDFTIVKRPEVKKALYEWALSMSSSE
ncbi:GH3 auxin-responsive promoter family protein [Bacteriovorax sp. PP10]|uniref:GH3 auxin-responsive promoter family protein n=1 Tax=Bacteriovorax antarcticus TaxID=3088717 RepID=A0ABU5VVB9_9BACT|nr:GH3 auxin-responsive promoter family protein [Bacteriovorax sp. PP10]MEA9356989.1 GH3 auxin-responsive promoter family protein [Bacteriovorax sp. PP10]